MKHQTIPVCRKDDILVQELKGEVLIYDLKINKAFCLNETSAIVWQLCDGNNSVADISRKFSKELNSPVTEDLVWLALDQLKQENLLSNSEEIVPEFNGMSRREVIRKVGLGTMVAIPIVSGVIAPTAAQAQSAGAGGGTPGSQTATCTGAVTACLVAGATCATATCPQQTPTNTSGTVNVGVCVCVQAQAAVLDPITGAVITAAVFSCTSLITCNTLTVTNNGVTLTSTTTATNTTTGAVTIL